MKKKNILLGLMALISAAPGFAEEQTETARPNVLFLSMDDLKPELGCYGSEFVKTPNIDRLAGRGVLFDHHYVQQAVCGPSRASMFSGLRPDTTKVWDLKHTCREECPQAFTMQEYFKKNGYETAGAGKIMHGFRNDDPLSWSIPYVRGSELPFADGKVPALYEQYQSEVIHEAYAELEASGIRKYKERQQFMSARNAKPSTECLDLPDNAYSDGAMTDWGISMLDQFAKADKPFFLTLGYRKPHLPFVAPKKYWDLFNRDELKLAEFQEQAEGSPVYAYHPGYELGGYSDIEIRQLKNQPEKQRELIHGYYACVAYVDAQIGKVFEKLKETGLDKNTIVVLWGDHGWHLGDHGIWCKHSTFEQATRSPLIIHDPRIAASGRSGSPVESVDIFPTLCELAELAVPDQLEGKSVVPILKDPAARVKEYSLSQYPDSRGKKNMGYSLRNERYRLVVWIEKNAALKGYDEQAIDSIQLYDYQIDPLETVSRADDPDYADTVEEMKSALAEMLMR
jgi:arylsulfatase A-like enzyme